MSANVRDRGGLGDEWSVPPGDGQFVDGEVPRYRLTWHPGRGRTNIAMFRVVTDDGVATLQHIRRLVTQQRGESRCVLDTEAKLEDVPKPLLDVARAHGLIPAEEGGE